MGSLRDSALSTSDIVRKATLPLGSREDFEPLLTAIGETGLVLIGEASHGTHEFYRVRAEITKRLLAEKGFGAVAIEGDWPDAWRVNRYVRGQSDDRDASEARAGFRRFPTPGKTPALEPPRLQRAIGVIYRPDTERLSHYFEARLGAQFDAVLHYDVTRAVEPLERGSLWVDREPPETYPTGI